MRIAAYNTAVVLLAALALAPAAQAATTSTDSPREANLPASQDFSHVSSTIDPATGAWSVAYSFYGAPSATAWGNLNAQLYTGASQCADFQAQVASFQESPSIPGDKAISGTVIPQINRTVRAAERLVKTFDGNTITLAMTDSSLVGVTATCVTATISHRGFLDQVGPLPFPGAPPAQPVPPEPGTTPPPPPPRLTVAAVSRQLRASRTGVVKVRLKPFNQNAAGAVTLRTGGKLIARGAYSAKSGKAVTVALKLDPPSRRSLKRHRSLSVTLTATAQAGAQVVAKAVRARVRG